MPQNDFGKDDYGVLSAKKDPDMVKVVDSTPPPPKPDAPKPPSGWDSKHDYSQASYRLARQRQ